MAHLGVILIILFGFTITVHPCDPPKNVPVTPPITGVNSILRSSLPSTLPAGKIPSILSSAMTPNLEKMVAGQNALLRQGHGIVAPYSRTLLNTLISANGQMSALAPALPGLLAAKGAALGTAISAPITRTTTRANTYLYRMLSALAVPPMLTSQALSNIVPAFPDLSPQGFEPLLSEPMAVPIPGLRGMDTHHLVSVPISYATTGLAHAVGAYERRMYDFENYIQKHLVEQWKEVQEQMHANMIKNGEALFDRALIAKTVFQRYFFPNGSFVMLVPMNGMKIKIRPVKIGRPTTSNITSDAASNITSELRTLAHNTSTVLNETVSTVLQPVEEISKIVPDVVESIGVVKKLAPAEEILEPIKIIPEVVEPIAEVATIIPKVVEPITEIQNVLPAVVPESVREKSKVEEKEAEDSLFGMSSFGSFWDSDSRENSAAIEKSTPAWASLKPIVEVSLGTTSTEAINFSASAEVTTGDTFEGRVEISTTEAPKVTQDSTTEGLKIAEISTTEESEVVEVSTTEQSKIVDLLPAEEPKIVDIFDDEVTKLVESTTTEQPIKPVNPKPISTADPLPGAPQVPQLPHYSPSSQPLEAQKSPMGHLNFKQASIHFNDDVVINFV